MGVKVGVTMSPFKGIARQKQRNIEKSDSQRKAARETKTRLGIPWTQQDHQDEYGNQEMYQALGGKSQSQVLQERTDKEAAKQRGIERGEYDYQKKTDAKYRAPKEPTFEMQRYAEFVQQNPGLTVKESITQFKQAMGGGLSKELEQLLKVQQFKINKNKLGEIGKGKQLSEKTTTDIAKSQSTEDMLKEYKKLFKPEFVGFMEGRVGSAQETFGSVPFAGEITGEKSDFYALESKLKNQIIQEITGAQMGEKEAERIMNEIPKRENPDKVWISRHRQTVDNLKRIRERKAKLLKAQGYRTTGFEFTDEKKPKGMPPAEGNGGRTIVDKVTKKKYTSDGTTWNEVQ